MGATPHFWKADSPHTYTLPGREPQSERRGGEATGTKAEKEAGKIEGGKETESNEFEEHVSNQILILAGGKGRKKGEKKSRRKRNGEPRHEGVSLILWTDSEMNEEIVH